MATNAEQLEKEMQTLRAEVERLLGIAMTTPPRPFWKIVGRPRLQGKARLAVAA